ncbi:uncharacterized protein [Dendropsophus ebraccatus]|uniref:uncharacterized protein isoform X1 n=1 Tax=Dendropsophus ebraccatus TaxID=150705 RepID=UPI0038313133
MEEETLKKFKEIRCIMEKTRPRKKFLSIRRPGHKVGVVGDVEPSDIRWLHEDFSEAIEKISFFSPYHTDPEMLYRMVSSCTLCIFTCSGYNPRRLSDMRSRNGFIFEHENLITIIHNLEDSSDREKERILQESPRLVQKKENLFLFSRMEKRSNGKSHIMNDHPPRKSLRRQKRRERQTIVDRNDIISNHHQQKPHTVGPDGRTERPPILERNDIISSDHRQQKPHTVGPDSRTGLRFFKKFFRYDRSQMQKIQSSDTTDLASLDPRGLNTVHGPPPAGDHRDPQSQRPETKAHRVGIFTRASERDYSWLVAMLTSEEFQGHVTNVRSCSISNNIFQKLINDIRDCTFGILYHSKNRGRVNITNVTDSLYDQELETLHMILGKEKVVVLIDDLEDSGEHRKTHILQHQHSIEALAADLLLVSNNDKMDEGRIRVIKSDLMRLLRGPGGHPPHNKEVSRMRSSFQPIPSYSRQPTTDWFHYNTIGGHPLHNKEVSRMPSSFPPMPSYNRQPTTDLVRSHPRASNAKRRPSPYGRNRASLALPRPEMKAHRVGIFTRASERDYSWLVAMLTSEEFQGHVTNVRSCSISNNQFQKLINDIRDCTFGILYHSKNRGRVNITNVTDSLYDEELETLHMILGKENVVVLIDDLEDSGDKRKKRILKDQCSIGALAADLLLVSDNDKMDEGRMEEIKSDLMRLLQGPECSLV